MSIAQDTRGAFSLKFRKKFLQFEEKKNKIK